MQQRCRRLGVLAGAAIGVACLASAQTSPPAVSRPFDIVMAIDDSGSMAAADPSFQLRQAITTFGTKLDDHDRLALVTFGTTSRIPLPLTPRANADFTMLLQSGSASLRYTERYTDIPGGVAKALYELQEHGRKDAHRVIVLVTDGFVDLADRTQVAGRKQWLQQDLQREATQQSVRVFGIGFTASADGQLLRSLTSATSGVYKEAAVAADFQAVLTAIFAEMQQPTTSTTSVPAAVAQMPTVAQPPQQDISRSGSSAQYIVVALAVLGLATLPIAYLVMARRSREALDQTQHRARLRTMTGEGSGIDLTRVRTLIGRESGCDVALVDSSISEPHALLVYSQGGFWLHDLRSSNGTFVQPLADPAAHRVHPQQPELLKHGDVVRFGGAKSFIFESEGGGGTTYVPATAVMPIACHRHPDRRPERVCDRCGDPLCAECGESHTCDTVTLEK